MKQDNQIEDIILVARSIRKNFKRLLIVSVVVFAVSCAIILPVPRYYNTSAQLAPELMSGDNTMQSLSNIASQFGFGNGDNASGDAIYPDLYPDLMKSNDFIIKLTNQRVKTLDGRVDTTYYQYIRKYKKHNPILAPIVWVSHLFNKNKHKQAEPEHIDIRHLTKEQSDILSSIGNKITCNIDKKTTMITITVEDQDPLVCATMANAAKQELQNFITDYRTRKARQNYNYYKKLTIDAKASYEKARRLYASYADANTEIILESYKSKTEDLENDMQLKFNAYTAMTAQLEQARAKVQENTPAFTVVKSPTVPLKPAGPKRMAFVAIMMILSWMVCIIYFNRNLIVKRLKNQ